MRDNDRELALLGGAELVDVIERGDLEFAVLAALACITPAARNLGKTPVVQDIPELAIDFIAKQSAARMDVANAVASPTTIAEGTSDQIRASCEAGNVPGLATPLAGAITVIENLASQNDVLSKQLRVTAEETNILWWLFGEHSRDLGVRFSTLKAPAAAIIIGKELSDLTAELPGNAAAAAFADKALRASRSKMPSLVKLKSAINETPAEWRQQVVKARWHNNALGNLMPILSGLRASLTVGPKDDWSPAFRHAVGFDAEVEIAPTELAYQMYLEGLLSRAWTVNK